MNSKVEARKKRREIYILKRTTKILLLLLYILSFRLSSYIFIYIGKLTDSLTQKEVEVITMLFLSLSLYF